MSFFGLPPTLRSFASCGASPPRGKLPLLVVAGLGPAGEEDLRGADLAEEALSAPHDELRPRVAGRARFLSLLGGEALRDRASLSLPSP